MRMQRMEWKRINIFRGERKMKKLNSSQYIKLKRYYNRNANNLEELRLELTKLMERVWLLEQVKKSIGEKEK